MAAAELHPALRNKKQTVGERSSERELHSSGHKLHCHCAANPVEVTISRSCLHNHLCGCTACWKPGAAVFSQVAVVPTDSLEVTAGNEKLTIVNKAAAIQRHACKDCGVHMYGRVVNPDHYYYGMDFIHPELLKSSEFPIVEFAGYVSSLIEGGVSPDDVKAIREQLEAEGLAYYDTLSPELMDVIAYHKRKLIEHRTNLSKLTALKKQ